MVCFALFSSVFWTTGGNLANIVCMHIYTEKFAQIPEKMYYLSLQMFASVT